MPRADAPLTVSYLFSQFPLPTEVFAVSDIRALNQLGHRVVVHTMKPPRADEAQRMASAAVPGDLAVMRPSPSAFLRWPALLWRRRRQAAQLARLVLRAAPANPKGAAVGLLCIPRALEIAEEVAAVRADVVHVFWSRYAALALPALRSMGHRAVRSTFVGAYDLVADDYLVRLAMANAQVVFSHAETNLPFLTARAAPGQPVHIVHRGIPLPPNPPEIERDGDMWVTASALVEAKNVEAVLRTFALAQRQRPSLRLTVCGDGPDRARLERIAGELGCADRIVFRGFVDRDSLFELMGRAGAFLILSKKASERLPNVVKEALWSGCAVITSLSEGIEELVPDRGVGHVVDPDDPADLAAAAEAILAESEAEAATRRERARALIAERFSSATAMGRYVDAWNAVRAGTRLAAGRETASA